MTKINMNVALVALGASLLAGCATPVDPMAEDKAACTAYGLNFGTPEFAQCMMMKDAQRNANRAAVAGAVLSNPSFFHH
jgi:hypothetical protein